MRPKPLQIHQNHGTLHPRTTGKGEDRAIGADMRMIQPPAVVLLAWAGERHARRLRAFLAAVFPRTPRGWAPISLGVGAIFSVLAWPLFGSGEYSRHGGPAWIDLLAGASYLFLLAGVLLLRRLDRAPTSRLRMLLDAFLSTTVVGAFSWYFVVGPALLHSNLTLSAKIVQCAYAVGDMTLLLCILPMCADSRDRALRPAIGILSAGLILSIAMDSVNQYCRLYHTHPVPFFAVLGLAGDVLICLGAVMAASELSRVIPEPEPEPAWDDMNPPQPEVDNPSLVSALLPYALVPAMGGLVIHATYVSGWPQLIRGVYAGAALLTLMLFLRQVVAVLEHAELYQDVVDYADNVYRLNAELRATQSELWGQQRALQDNNRVLQIANERLQALATSDALTGLANHRSMIALLDNEVERAQRYEHGFAVAFIDLDHFKAVNDSFGHPMGDAALREFASVVHDALRGPDILGRWGGEEFVAILPETDAEGAMGVAERVRAAVAGHAFKSAGRVHITCSCGVANFPGDAPDRDGIIAMADRAMYASKRLGRNQVRAASDPAVLALWAQDTEAGVRGEGTLVATVEALAGLVEARDHCTGEHVDAVAALAVRLALELGLDTSDAHTIGLAARLHDVGKVAIPDAILRKPGRLNAEEAELMQTHPAVGAAVIARVPALSPLAPIIRGHHEWWNGTGYPDRLMGDEIPLGARIVTVADAYKAMTADRPYRRGCPPAVALNELRRCAGTQFDPAVVDKLEAVLWPNPFLAERVIKSESYLY